MERPVLGLRVLALWVVVGRVMGFIWGTIVSGFQGFGTEQGFGCALIGIVQGVVGGFYQSITVTIRKTKWLTDDWPLHAVITVVPSLVFLYWIAVMTQGGGNIVEGWFVPFQVLLCSYLTADLVNREIANIAPLA